MFEIASRDSGAYARLLIGRARHLMLNARQKEVAPYHIFLNKHISYSFFRV